MGGTLLKNTGKSTCKEDTMDVFQLLVLIIGFSGISTPILLALILWRVW